MINLQLYILNDEQTSYDEIELFDNETVSYTQTLQDIKDIQKVFSDFTRTFSVPASRQNNKVFKHFYNYFIDGFNPKRRHKAKIYLNYKLYQEGYVKMEGATTKDNAPHTYRITFFGQGIILKDVLKDSKLSSLGKINEFFNFNYTSSNVRLFMQNGLDVTFLVPKTTQLDEPTDNQFEVEAVTIEDALVFPIISHTKRFIYNTTGTSANANSDIQNNIAGVVDSGSDKYGLEITQLKPAIRIHSIIKAIEADYRRDGIEFSTDFFNETNLSYYNLYMWLHTKTGGLFTDQEEEAFVTNLETTSTAKGFIGLAGKNFPPGIITPTHFETPIPTQSERRKRQERTIRIKIETTNTNEITLLVKKDGNEFHKQTGTPDNGVFVGARDLVLPEGRYQFAVISDVPGTFALKGLVQRDGKADMEFEGSVIIGSDKKIYTASQMPDMKIIDFLTGLFKMFNLTAFQEDGKIKVQTLDSFYAASSSVFDITPYIDKDTVTVDSVVPYRQVNFKFKGLNSFLAKSHQELFNIEWGGLHFEENKGNLGQVYEIEAPFEHFKFEKLYDAADNSDTGILFGWSADEKQEPNIGEPLLFYAVKTAIKEPLKTRDFDDSIQTFSTGTQLYLPSNSVEVSDNVSDSSNINFNAEINEYQEVPFVNSLFEKYYKNYIKEIFDPQRRLTKTQAYLPLRVLMNIKLNDRVKITDKLFKINKITTNYQTLLSNLELINTKSVAGSTIITDTIFRQGQLPSANSCETADTLNTLADNTLTLVDCTNVGLDGAIFKNDSNNGTTAEGNNIPTSENGKPVTVTPAEIFDPHLSADTELKTADSDLYKADINLRQVTSSTFNIGYQVKTLGKIGTADNIDEYGFLWSTTEADLVGTDVDDIAAVSGVTKINYPTASNNKRPPVPFNSSYKNNSAASGTSYYFRFYARTNTDIRYAEADIISETEEITTL